MLIGAEAFSSQLGRPIVEGVMRIRLVQNLESRYLSAVAALTYPTVAKSVRSFDL